MSKKKSPVAKKTVAKPAERSNRYDYLVMLLILVLTIFIYSGSLKNGFVNWDDDMYVYKNPGIQNLSSDAVADMFSNPYYAMYIPVTMLSYAMEYKLSAANPYTYHLTNLILHLVNIILVFALFRSLKISKWVAAFIALLFAIHPMHAESVAWVSERKDVLYTMFFLAALVCYVKFVSKGSDLKYYLLTIVLFILSLLSKSAAVVLPLVLVAVDYYMGEKWYSMKRVIQKLPFFALSLVFGLISIMAQKSSGATEISETIGFADRFLIACYAILVYVFKLILPVNLSNLYPYPGEGEYYILLISAVAIAAITFVVYRFARKNNHIIFGLLFFFINVILVLNIIPIGQSYMAERYTYVSYIGLFFIVGQLGNNLIKNKKQLLPLMLILLFGFVIYFSYTTYERNKIWKSSETLWTDAIEKNPSYFYGYYGKGNALRDLKQYKDAIPFYSKAIELNPKYSSAYSDRGVAYDYSGDYDNAMKDYNNAISINPAQEDAYINRGILKSILKQNDSAMIDFNTAIKLNDKNHLSWFNRGVLYLTLNKTTEACADWAKAKELGSQQAKEMIVKFCK